MGFQMLKEMELQCNSLWLVRARANREQADGKLAEKAGRLAPAIHKEHNTFLASQYPQRGFISHPELNKHARMFGAGFAIALYDTLSFTPVQRAADAFARARPGAQSCSAFAPAHVVPAAGRSSCAAALLWLLLPPTRGLLICSWVNSQPHLPLLTLHPSRLPSPLLVGNAEWTLPSCRLSPAGLCKG